LLAEDPVGGNVIFLSPSRTPEWAVSDDTAVPLQGAFTEVSVAPETYLAQTTDIVPTMLLYRRSLNMSSNLSTTMIPTTAVHVGSSFPAVWPSSINSYALDEATMSLIIANCTRWMSGSIAQQCFSLFPSPAQFYWLACLRETALTEDSNSGLQAVFSFASYCEVTLGLTRSPAQSLCNEGIETTWIGPNCDQECYFGHATTYVNGTVYCKCDPLHYGPDLPGSALESKMGCCAVDMVSVTQCLAAASVTHDGLAMRCAALVRLVGLVLTAQSPLVPCLQTLPMVLLRRIHLLQECV